MRQVKQIMGLPISIDIPAAKSLADFEPGFKILREIDEQFSTYKPDSEVSRYARGELKNPSPKLANVIKECKKYEAETDGYFSSWAGGTFDPNGYVKGWAIRMAGEQIEKSGFETYCIGAGGDILARSNDGKIWKIGIQDPLDSTKILDLLSISNGAVTTSGNYERGHHIINPKTKKPADELMSVTIVGPDIVTADVLATAIFAKGSEDATQPKPGYGILLVTKNNKVYKSVNFHNPGSNR